MTAKKKMLIPKKATSKKMEQKAKKPKVSPNFRDDPWYQTTFNSIAISLRKRNEVHFNFLFHR